MNAIKTSGSIESYVNQTQISSTLDMFRVHTYVELEQGQNLYTPRAQLGYHLSVSNWTQVQNLLLELIQAELDPAMLGSRHGW